MIHDAKIEKPRVADKGPQKGMSDPVITYDWEGLYGISWWDDNDQMWHEIIDGEETTYGDGIAWWADIPTPRGWAYDSEYYSSGFNAEKFEEDKKAMEMMGFRKPHPLQKGEANAQENNNP